MWEPLGVPTPTPAALAAAVVEADPAFASVVATVGPPKRRNPTPPPARFATVVGSVTSQLLSVKAANTIYARVVEACGGTVTTSSVLARTHEELRATGLSNAKVASILDLAARVDDGRLNLARHGRMADEAVASELAAVKGIGEWTAHMYLMFTLGRPDIWPVGDLGVRAGWSILHGVDPMVSAKDLVPCGTPFVGFRSTAAWYCWQAVHLARGDA